MNFIQKKFKPLIVACFVTLLFSCNNSTEKTAEPAKAADSVVTATPPAPVVEAPKLSAPFDMMEINHTVKDYAVWKKAFDLDSTARSASGLGLIALASNLDKPNALSIAMTVADVKKAKAFAADPRLKDVMEKNGVISKPDISYWHVLRINPDSKEKQWVLVTHKVKDFATWLKAYDAEGTATRAANGLIDVALARGIDDSSIVHIIFDITDLAKAKARINSPELKKIMTGAGVISAPKIEFYKSAE